MRLERQRDIHFAIVLLSLCTYLALIWCGLEAFAVVVLVPYAYSSGWRARDMQRRECNP